LFRRLQLLEHAQADPRFAGGRPADLPHLLEAPAWSRTSGAKSKVSFAICWTRPSEQPDAAKIA
jgi:hypothetical protein